MTANPWEKNYNPKLTKQEIQDDFFGVFASEDIQEGELIFKNWNDSCTKMSIREVKRLPKDFRLIFEKYSTEIEPYVYVGPYPGENVEPQMDYFINHSCDPNAWLVNDNDVVARRAIKAGEQVTVDYATLIIHEFESSRIIDCLCGSANCRKILKGNDWWNMRKVYHGHYVSWIQKKINDKEAAKLEKVKTLLPKA